MSGPFGSQQWMYSSGFYPHEIDNSVRFDSNSQLSKTPSSTGNMRTWTFSAWIKRSKLSDSGYDGIFSAGTGGVNRDVLYFDDGDKLHYNGYTSSAYDWQYKSTQQFRDPSAWYHIVIATDTNQDTYSDRIKIYVNNEQITAWDEDDAPNRYKQGYVNNTNEHTIGSTPYDTTYFDGYITEVNFVDGAALTPASFGETKADTWIPKAYTGSYGSLGYYLKFGNSSSLGTDSSGNGNTWTVTNIVATDQVPDSPTNNFATINPLATPDNSANVSFSQGNLRVDNPASNYGWGDGTIPLPKTGKWVFEVLFLKTPTGASPWCYNSIGVLTDTQWGSYATDGSIFYGIDDSGGTNKVFVEAGTAQGTHAGFPAGTIVQVFADRDNNQLTFSIDGTLQTQTDSTVDIPAGVDLVPATGNYEYINIINFGQDSSFAGEKTAQGNTDANGRGDFHYAPPAGYLALCSANMPDPAAAFNPAVNNSPQDHFNTVLYTGNGGTQSVSGVGFQPDWIWAKSRSASGIHNLFDVVRGANKYLSSNDNSAEATPSSNNRITSIDADGFTLGNSTNINESSTTYVGWNWKAGGTGVSNSDGSITSTVSANTDSGFSVFTWTGTGSSATIGHGLGQTPKVVFWKRRDSTENWSVQSTLLSAQTELELSGTAAESATDTRLGSTADWTSSVVSVISYVANNASSGTYVAYCFAEKEGFSKFGKYTGNGNADGPFIHTGFRPAFVMIKNASSGTQPWGMYDNRRVGYNEVVNYLQANDSSAEVTSIGGVFYGQLDFVSNGFKIRESDSFLNGSGNTLIYMAFAEMPFKYANAR